MSSDEKIAPAENYDHGGQAQLGLSKAIQELAPGAQMLRSLLLIIDAHALVSVTDRAGRIIYSNDRFCEVCKYQRHELLGQTHRIVKSDFHPASFYEEIWSTIASGANWTGDIQNKAKDGSLYWVQSTISPIFNAQNQIAGYGSIRTDVTAHRRLMAELKDSEKTALGTLKSAIDIIDSSLLVADASGHIVITNHAYSAMYPESAQVEQSGIHFSQLASKHRPDLSQEDIAEFALGVMTEDTTEQHVLADGRTVKIQRKITPGGGFVSLHTDITDMVRQTYLLETQAATMDLMKAIAVDANESTDADTAYSRCLEHVCKYTGWEVGHVYLLTDSDTQRLVPADIWYCSQTSQFNSFQETTAGISFEAGTGLPGRVFESGSPAWVHDVTRDPNYPRAVAAKASGLVGGAAFPVKIQDDVVAVLEFYSSQPVQTNPQLEEILSHVCAQMGRVEERKRTEKSFKSRVARELGMRDRELVKQNKLFDAALENMSQGLCMFDAEKRLIVSNDRYAQIYDLPQEVMRPGITLGEILEYRIANGIFSGANPEEYIKERMAWVESGEFSNKVQHLSDGRSIAIAHQPMPGGAWLTTHEDITERVESQKALRESEQRFKDIVEVSSDWIWECDEDLRFTYLSARVTQVTGVPREQILGKTRHELGMDSDADWDSHLADLKARRPFRDFKYSMTDTKGETQHWVISGRPVFDSDGTFKGYRGTGADRTVEVRDQAELIRHRDHLQDIVNEATAELKQRADELRVALTRERELNEIQRQFVSMASHEFRTPLAIIDSAAQRLLRKADKLTPGDTVKRVEKIRGAVGRMTQLMESTLDAARIEEGKINITIEECDLRYVVLEVLMNEIEISPNHDITCDLKDLPYSVQGDSNAFAQIFSNLVSNAVKYSPDTPNIHVKGWQDKGFAVVEFADQGLGIDSDDLPNLFQRFFRAKTSAGIAGTGIGLNLVKTLIELHDGNITVESSNGKGSLFKVFLPINGPLATGNSEHRAA